MHLILKLVFYICSYTIISAIECEDNIKYHLSTKTPYRFVANQEHKEIKYKGCEAQKIWMMTRHGTRNPAEKLINVMNNRLVEIKDQILDADNNLLNSDIELFKKWKPTLEASDEKKLTYEGKSELVDLGERMQARFPDLLSNIYSNTSYKFKFTHTQRAKASAINFAIGLFGKKTAKDVWFPEPSKKDPILRFYKLCNKWRDEVKKNPKALVELDSFIKSDLMKNVVKKVGIKSGLGKEIKFEDVHAFYTTCAFETAWNKKKSSPWCALFDLATIKVMEYNEDLEYYYIDGYAYNITYKQACPASRNMMNFLDDSEVYPKAVLYFAHSGTLLKLLAHFDLYKDEIPLTHNQIDANRKWKVSKIDAFGTNLAFVSFNCNDAKKLLVLHQEKVVRFPACPDTDLCPIETIKEYYKDSMDHCNFNEMCNTAAPGA